MKTTPPQLSWQRDQRGSVLIVAALFAAIIAVSLGSYMVLASTSLKLANRTFYSNAAVNLAETGIEEALWSFNQANAGVAFGTAWSGWTITPTTGTDGTAQCTFTNFNFAGGTAGTIKVYVDHYNPPKGVSAKVVALATVTIPNSATPVTKQIEVTLSKRSYFAMGMVAENTITFAGNNAYVDSWNSAKDSSGNPLTPPEAYNSSTNKKDNGSIGAAAVGVSITVQNADIYGTASVGGSNAAASIDTGPNGRVGSFSAPAGYEDPARISGGFNPQLEIPKTPTISGAPLTTFGSTLGTTGATTSFRSTVAITGPLTIEGDVTLVIDVLAGDWAINLSANSDDITIPNGSSLIIYTPGNVKATGNSEINNLNAQPITFQLYGTSTTTQNIDVGGNGVFKGAIYAPTANIKLHGNGDVQGSVVGRDITVVGNAKFHYDESMADFDGGAPFGPDNWRELWTAAERAIYTTQLNF